MTTAFDTTAQAPQYAARPAETNGFSIASLVLGLVSILAGFTFFLPVAGVVLGILALRREPASRTMAIWGIVLNSIMLAGAVIGALFMLVVGAAFLPFAFLGLDGIPLGDALPFVGTQLSLF
ncbi:DUF4190 domain-containing protein [Agromyces sp. LHK192]|uniref:DUF4190 domain-containing protein n=1 Tax=Agromyces sp. LHK192 TaxID=2498704 RepID=UPI000FDABB3F|nr:DUF4190 domain-containing protein [Agromyces sp. LHK192]